MTYQAEAIRREFPIFDTTVHGRPLVYLDNAATTQKPREVIERVERYYREENANVHRGVHALAERATEAYERSRATLARFLNAADPREIVFVRGTTEAINLVARSFARPRIRAGEEIAVTVMEHHSNIVPWQMLCEEMGARLRVIPMTDRGELRHEDVDAALHERTRLVAVTHVSNALGTVNPVRDIVTLARARAVPVLVDGAQAVGRMRVDVQALDCDFYACSGHKMYGPTGIGVLYGRRGWLESMPPYQGGGDMVASVSFDKTTYREAPHRFEAGTPHVAGAVGLAAAVEFLDRVGLDRIEAHERALVALATDALGALPGVRLIGRAAHRIGILSFACAGIHPHDVATVLDREGVAIRAGHHCCQPLMDRLGVAGTARASLAVYNTRGDIDVLVRALHGVQELLG
jgi:cysteine desulfurase/selenocysteine lyase